MHTAPAAPLFDNSVLAPALRRWLDSHALALDEGHAALSAELLPTLAQAGLLRIGVAPDLGGAGGDVRDAVRAIAEVASHSMTAAFVLWGQRAFIDYVCATANPVPRERWLARLLEGRLAGAVGLSNVMKFLSQVEALQVHGNPAGAGGWTVSGNLPWVTNVRPEAFVVAAAIAPADGAPIFVAGIEGQLSGVQRSADLDLLGMRASQTAALSLQDVAVDAGAVLAQPGPPFLKAARPGFLGMQCGLSLGLARAALQAAREGGGGAALQARVATAVLVLQSTEAALLEGLTDGRWVADVLPLFELRMRLAGLVQEALQLELLASGGRAYLRDQRPGFGRRWRESAFIPVVTPSLNQLQGEIDRHRAGEGA